MGALKRTHDGTVNATCTGGCARPLDWTVQTEEHAVNVLNKHNREYHPDEPPFTVHTAVVDFQPDRLAPETAVAVPEALDLTAAARAVVDLDHAAAYAVWSALTDCSPSAVRAAVTALAEHDGTITAHVTPF